MALSLIQVGLGSGLIWKHFEADVSLTLFIGGDDLKEAFEQVSFDDC